MSEPTLFDDPHFDADPGLRVLAMWYPDWPVLAAFPDIAANEPLAVLRDGAVLACSEPARRAGVRRGMRRREAQSRLPELRWAPHNPEEDARAFEPLLGAMEHIAPGVELVRPGLCLTGAQGPTRYFGGEEPLIDALGEHLESLGFPAAKFGVADGPFAAMQAARVEAIVPVGASPSFLAQLPVDVLDDEPLTGLLRRLGLRTLGDFARLPANQVAARFGAAGVAAHRVAAGRERRHLAARTPPADLTLAFEFDPPLENVETIAFASRQHADRFVARLARRDLVCTALEVRLLDEGGSASKRVWRHPGWFTAADVVDRVRWQVRAAVPASQAPGISGGGALAAPLSRVSFIPRDLDRVGEHADGLYDQERSNDRLHRAFSRVQSMLEHTALLTPTPSGGRSPRESYTLTPWGESASGTRDPLAPWPGRLPDPAPAQLTSPPEAVLVLGADDAAVRVDERGFLTAAPALLRFRSRAAERVTSWAGPWHSDERWWDSQSARQLSRIQTVTPRTAYLLALSATGWWVEGIYD